MAVTYNQALEKFRALPAEPMIGGVAGRAVTGEQVRAVDLLDRETEIALVEGLLRRRRAREAK